MSKEIFTQLAEYNQWANTRLYGMARALPDKAYRRDVGLFFASLHGTLNHLMVADRIWLKRLTGEGTALKKMDAILYDDLGELWEARVVLDERILAFVESRREPMFGKPWKDETSGRLSKGTLAELLSHFFNHQTHHRGQAHACLSILGVEPQTLDLLQFQAGKRG